ncbi:MAG TPA: VCBS repeat-containing protein, partial [Planctomycetaceae bacterium]|nr:VCBS repeat-containing protein [Planctomycetaceae bacterium]
RANQWKYVDYDGDGRLDVVVGVGDWTDYGWDNAFDSQGRWTRGPLHGYVYLLRNQGTNEHPRYDGPTKIEAGGRPIDVFGMPSPNFADFDGDGDLDLLCGEFVDGFAYFENIGSRTKPRYASGRTLMLGDRPLTMDLCMIVPVAVDWDQDGDVDLVVGQEDGRVALIEHTGRVQNGLPVFRAPRFFQQEADDVKFGALATPVGFDWDGDGDQDIVTGNTAGYIGFIENLGPIPGSDTPKWAAPVLLKAGGRTLRILAGPNGSIQGPCEAKWGYTTLSVADWNHDGLPDLVVNSIWGRVVWFRNVGTRSRPRLAAAEPIRVAWRGSPPKPAWNWWNPKDNELATQWRTTPVVIDLNGDGLNDLVMLDHEGYLAFFERKRVDGKLELQPPRRVFRMVRAATRDSRHLIRDPKGGWMRLNSGLAGRSGRRKLCFTDWDGDGAVDLLVNSVNVNLLRNTSTATAPWTFEDLGPVDHRRLAGHTTSPTTVDWNQDGRPDLLIGAEDGYFYYRPHPTLKKADGS